MPRFWKHLTVFFIALLLCDSLRAASPPILLANVLGAHIDPSLYLVSEKYDGVRAIWDGKTLRFRSGRTVNAPDWFLAKLPSESLDGELWLARGGFDQLSGMVRKISPQDEDWQQIKYMLFELPNGAGSFADRYRRLQEIAAAVNWPQLVVVEQVAVANRVSLKHRLDAIVKAGGEGLMLHLKSAPYITGRSDVLLKLKPLTDTEALVIDHLPGKGKYKGQMGALRVEMPGGKRFDIGTGFTDIVRANPPPVGSQITYTYRGLTNSGTPRFASYLRVREEF